MSRYLALLRGINVGSHKKIAMSDLRAGLDGLGYTDVKTHLQSGNAVFTSSKAPKTLAREIEDMVDRDLCAGIKVIVRSQPELAAVIEDNPLPEAEGDGSRFLVAFLSGAPAEADMRDVDPAQFTPDEFRFGRREIYVWCPSGVMASKLGNTFWERRLHLIATMRNWNTVRRLNELTGT